MSWLILGFVLFLNHATLGQQDGDEMSLMDIINATEQLSEVGKTINSAICKNFLQTLQLSFSLKINFLHALCL